MVHQETGARVAGRDRLVHGALGGLAGGRHRSKPATGLSARSIVSLQRPRCGEKHVREHTRACLRHHCGW